MPACLRPDLPPSDPFAEPDGPEPVLAAKLDQNEAPIDLPEALRAALARAAFARPCHRYATPREHREARARVAEAVGVAPENVALTVGGGQAILAAFQLAAGPGRRARWFEPTYPYIPHAARITATIADPIVLGEDLDERLTPAHVGGDLLVLVSPNNPTGGSPTRAVCDAALADRTRLVLCDEAYADFAGATLIAEACRRDNLLVARTLSKSLAARVRLGFAVGHPALIAAIDRIYTAPYHLNGLQLAAAALYPEILAAVRAAVPGLLAERGRVAAALRARPGLVIREGQANFLLVRVTAGRAAAAALCATLAAAGVRVRDVSGLPGLSAHLRITVGAPAENDALLAAVAGSP
jgi:histidinol-phosphate aminotransferase